MRRAAADTHRLPNALQPAAMNDRLKIVVVGCGQMAGHWVRHTLEAPELELVGLVDLDRAAAERLAASHEQSGELVYDSLAAAITATGADAVFDVTVPTAHHAVTLQALEMGCHVLGEKPMATSLSQAREMVAAAEAAGKVYAVTQTRRADSGFKSIERFLSEGGLGEVAEIHSDFYLSPRFGGFRDAMDHPLLMDMAIHAFDNARQLVRADPVSVYCHSWNPERSWYAGHASVAAIFEMTRGIVYTYRGSWCGDGLNTAWNAQWRIIGGKGTLRWDGEGEPVCQTVPMPPDQGSQPPTTEVEIPKIELDRKGHGHLIRQFGQHLLSGGKTPLECPAADNIKSLAMVLAAVQSTESGQKVQVVW